MSCIVPPQTFAAKKSALLNSTFFSSLPLIKKRHPDYDITDEKWMADQTIQIADEVQGFINRSYDIYGKRFHNVDVHRFDIKQENINVTTE